MSSFINFKNCGYTPHPEGHSSESMILSSVFTQQSSKHALTFDELQHTLGGSGKDFGSMDMDELLKNVSASDETRTIAPNSDLGVTDVVNSQKQGSLTLPRTLGPKTVDAVWKELVNNGEFNDGNLIKEPILDAQQKQLDLDELTLEEFLRKAGVVPGNDRSQTTGRLSGDENSFVFGFENHLNHINGFHQHAVVTDNNSEVNNLQGVRSSKQLKQQKILPKQSALVNKSQMGSPVNGVSIYGKIDNPVNLANEPQLGSRVNGVSIIGKRDHQTKSNLKPRSPSDLFQNSNLDTSPSPHSYAYGEGGVCGRNIRGSLKEVVERRRKRMIKNRESAARSRARKQAYTLQLEAEVAKLKQLNHELQKKQEEIMESHNFQVPEKKLWGNRKSCLRRTVTGPW